MRKTPENRALPPSENRVAMTALGATKDFKGKIVAQGQSFMAADEEQADRLIAIGRAEIRKQKLGKVDAKQTDESGSEEKRRRKSPGSSET